MDARSILAVSHGDHLPCYAPCPPRCAPRLTFAVVALVVFSVCHSLRMGEVANIRRAHISELGWLSFIDLKTKRRCSGCGASGGGRPCCPASLSTSGPSTCPSSLRRNWGATCSSSCGDLLRRGPCGTA